MNFDRDRLINAEHIIDKLDIDILEKLAKEHIDINIFEPAGSYDFHPLNEQEKRDSLKEFLYEDYSYVEEFLCSIESW